MPTVYTHGHHESVLRSHRWRTAENSAAYLLPACATGSACSTSAPVPGQLPQISQNGSQPGRVCGIDVSPAIIDAARGEYPKIAFSVTDVYHLPFRDASWDVVHAHQVLQHLSRPVAALREMRRVVRTGGIVAARDADYATFTWHPASEELERWRRLYQEIARANGGEPDAGRQLVSWAREAGFRHVETSASTWCFATREERSWWGGLWADRMTESAIADQAVNEGRASAEELAAMAQAWRTWAAADDGWFAVIHGEVVCT